MDFQPLPKDEPIRSVIKAAFDADLPVSGGWGYDKNDAMRLEALPPGHSVTQTEHMLASMRTYLEMHLTLPKETRYGSINLNETERETIEDESGVWHRVVYQVDAMKERDYESLIEEYKKGYGKEDFDIEAHFRKRKEATFQRMITVWFLLSFL